MPWEKRPGVEPGMEMVRWGCWLKEQVSSQRGRWPCWPLLALPSVPLQFANRCQQAAALHPQWESLGLPPASQDGER